MKRLFLLLALVGCDARNANRGGGAEDMGADLLVEPPAPDMELDAPPVVVVVDAEPDAPPVPDMGPDAPPPPECEGVGDPDEDGLDGCAESLRRTDDGRSDTDGNGLMDGQVLVGERVRLRGDFETPPGLRLGGVIIETELEAGGAAFTVPGRMPEGPAELRLRGEPVMTLEVVRASVVIGAEAWRVDGRGARIGAPVPLAGRAAGAALTGLTELTVAIPSVGLQRVDLVSGEASEPHPLLGAVDLAVHGERLAVLRVDPPRVDLLDRQLEPITAHAFEAQPGGLAANGEAVAVSLPALDELLLLPEGRRVSLPTGSRPRALAWDGAAWVLTAPGTQSILRVAGEVRRRASPVAAPTVLTPNWVGGLASEVARLDGAPIALDGVPGWPSARDGGLWVPLSYARATPGEGLGALLRIEGDEVGERRPAPAGAWRVLTQPGGPR